MNNAQTVVEATIDDLHTAIGEGHLTAMTIVEKYINRIERFDREGPEINSIITINPQARERAEYLDTRYEESGLVGPLHGIPVLVKDQIATEDMVTTFGSEAFASYTPHDDAVIIQQVRDAGGIILAKTNLPDWAAGFVGYSSANGQTKNPYSLDRDSGGSSAGTGAGVAANFGTVGIGEDTGGSIRVPASCCNLYGLRPTTGLISRTGLSPLVKRQDTPGPMGRSVDDIARLLDVLVEFDQADERTGATTMAADAGSYVNDLRETGLENTRIGVLRDVFGDMNDPSASPVNDIVADALEIISNRGATLIDPVAVPDLSDQLDRSSLHALQPKHDINNFLSKLQNPPVSSIEELHESGSYHEALELFEIIADAPADPTGDVEYWRAVAAQESLRESLAHLFASERLDAVVFPDVQVIPPKYAALHSGDVTRDDYPVNTVISSQASCPSISMPAGLTEEGLPVGLELLGMPYSEGQLLSMAYAFEQATKTRTPPESTPALE